MATPVVVSRIQNRRGLQIEFDGYPWSGGAGPDSVYPQFYTGISGYGFYPDFNATNYPNVLLPGEICLCTDTQNIYMGDVNGTYVIIATGVPGGVALDQLTPIVWELPGTGAFTLITRAFGTIALEYDATPFFNIMYSATDVTLPEWNLLGPTFGENGTLHVTAVQYFTPNIPYPPYADITPVTLVKTGQAVVDKSLPFTVSGVNLSFEAQYDVTHTKIQIYYKHDYEGSIFLSTNTIKWKVL